MSYYDFSAAQDPEIQMSINDKTFVINVSQFLHLTTGGNIGDSLYTSIISVPVGFDFIEINQIKYNESFQLQLNNGNDMIISPGSGVPLPFNTKFNLFGLSGNNYLPGVAMTIQQYLASNLASRFYSFSDTDMKQTHWDINFIHKKETKKTFFSHLNLFVFNANGSVENLNNYYLAYYSGIDAAIVSASAYLFTSTVSYQGKILSEREYYDRHKKVKGITKIR